MRWPFGPPHLTLKPSNKKHQKNKTKKNKQKKTKQKNKKKKKKKKPKKKQQKHQKLAFQLSVKFFLFLGGFSKFPFLTPWPKKPEPQKHYKTRGFRAFFLESRCASRNGHFWTKKPKIYKFQLYFFCLFSSLSKSKTQKSAETPIFIVFLLT